MSNFSKSEKEILKILSSEDIDEAYKTISSWKNYKATPLLSLDKLKKNLKFYVLMIYKKDSLRIASSSSDVINGIKSDYHYHFQLNITINDERKEIPMKIGFDLKETGEIVFLHPLR